MRIELRVPFAEKDEAKYLGARWDPIKRTWYVENRLPVSSFAKWLPFPLSSNSSGVSENKALKEVSGAGQVMLGGSHTQQPNVCDCTLWGECERCVSMRSGKNGLVT